MADLKIDLNGWSEDRIEWAIRGSIQMVRQEIDSNTRPEDRFKWKAKKDSKGRPEGKLKWMARR